MNKYSPYKGLFLWKRDSHFSFFCGGIDGTKISYNGIPCPNLGTGGHNFHSVYEYVCLEDMMKVSEILLSIIRQFSNDNVVVKK